MKTKIKEYQKKYGTSPLHYWQFTNLVNWEYMLLKDIGAINEKGIVADYPVLSVSDKKGEKTTVDLGGDIVKLNQAKNDFNVKNGDKAKIIYIPKKYIEFKDALQDLDKETFAKNSIPLPQE